MHIELLARPEQDTAALLERLARLLALLDIPLRLRKRVVADLTLPTPALRVEGDNLPLPLPEGASDEELLELLDELLGPH